MKFSNCCLTWPGCRWPTTADRGLTQTDGVVKTMSMRCYAGRRRTRDVVSVLYKAVLARPWLLELDSRHACSLLMTLPLLHTGTRTRHSLPPTFKTLHQYGFRSVPESLARWLTPQLARLNIRRNTKGRTKFANYILIGSLGWYGLLNSVDSSTLPYRPQAAELPTQPSLLRPLTTWRLLPTLPLAKHLRYPRTTGLSLRERPIRLFLKQLDKLR